MISRNLLFFKEKINRVFAIFKNNLKKLTYSVSIFGRRINQF